MLVPRPAGVLSNPLEWKRRRCNYLSSCTQVPGKLRPVVRRYGYIVKLIRRIKTVFRTGNHIVRHHIILALECTVADIGIRT